MRRSTQRSARSASQSPNLSLIDHKVPRGSSLYRKHPISSLASSASSATSSTAAAAAAGSGLARTMDEQQKSPTEKECAKVVIGVKCRNLPVDRSFAVISLHSGSYMTEKDTVTTETVDKTNSPAFSIPLITSYKFEERQMVELEVHCAVDDHSSRTHGRQLIGSCTVSLGHLIHSGGSLDCQLCSSGSAMCTIHVEEYAGNKENMLLKLNGRGLDKKDLFGKSDPYMIIDKRNDKGRMVRAYRTEVIKNTLDPDWKPIKVSVDRLCSGDFRREIRFRCFDWDGAEGDHEDKDIEFDEFIGEFATTPKELFSNEGREVTFELINPRKAKKKKNYKNSGMITAKTIPIDAEFSFLDYMFSGTDLCFTVAIDMTASNGSPSQPTSLHYTDPFTPNQYTIAMQAVLEIIQDYDSDQLLPAFGFGCRAPPDYRVSHEWPLNGDSSNPFCRGAAGVLDAYRRCLEEVRLSGPTNFAPVIKHVSRLALNHQDGSRYYVLLILTDGTIDDWTECKKAVIEASYLPVSIIVVGIGSGNFTEMELLDQDVWLLEEGGQKACRDIVQFVELRKYLRVAADGTDGIRWSKVALAKDVLQELPSQILEYMRRRRLKPNRPKASAAASASSG